MKNDVGKKPIEKLIKKNYLNKHERRKKDKGGVLFYIIFSMNTPFILALLASFLVYTDAIVTYIVIISGIGYEANPFLSHINNAPTSVFIYAIVVSIMPIIIYMLYIITIQRKIYMISLFIQYTLYFITIYRAIVVLNNLLILFFKKPLIEMNI